MPILLSLAATCLAGGPRDNGSRRPELAWGSAPAMLPIGVTMRSFLKPVPWFLIASLMIAPARAEKKVFHTPKLGTNLGVWRLTADPTVRHHANYHNTQCWSPDGQIAEREYYTSAGVRVSREILAPGGHVAETLYYARDGQTESAHWWFDRGQPVKLVRGGKTYVTRGDRFGRIDGDRFVDTPRGPYSE